MDTTKIIKGVVGGGKYTVTSPIVKEDYGLYLKIEGLELPETYQVDFSNSEHNGTSVTMIGNSDGVLIPNQFISSGKDVFAFLYHVGEDYGRTIFKFRIPNKLRPDRTDDIPTPEEQSVIDQAISALNLAVEQTAQDVIDADASAQSASQSAEQAQTSARTAGLYSDTAQTYANSAEISANSASASATASANSASQSAQIKTDVEDLVDDARGYASASAQSASASANSASQAHGYAQSASASAQSASGYASQADISANTASNKASEASTSAQTASQKATEASQSASQALTYKTDAESAKTASQTAQGLAESARDSAISAKTDAESAKDDAESARDEAQQAVASISGALAEKAPVITDTASGSIASFSDGADDLPLKLLVVDINPIQDLSNGDPSPENICPISGWTSVDVEQSGKNLFDKANAQYINGYFTGSAPSQIYSGNAFRTVYVPCKPNTTYRMLNKNNSGKRSVGYTTELPRAGVAVYASAFDYITTGADAKYLVCYVFNSTTDSATLEQVFDGLQIELGSTATPYEPYIGRSITIDLGQTVYGGKLDVLSGELTVDRAMVDLGTLSSWWKVGTINADTYRYTSNEIMNTVKKPSTSNIQANIVCSSFKAITGSWAYRCHDGVSITQSGDISIYDSRYDKPENTATEFKNAMNGVMLCYELAEPIEIQLSANQINSLYGVNNLWADSGDTTAEYRADTRLYIEKLTQPEEDDMVADSAITSGQFFMVGNSLYRALANIASGAIITVGTNAQRVSLADALNLVNA